jgi:hypothetical protein
MKRSKIAMSAQESDTRRADLSIGRLAKARQINDL